jgi:hypothetical protein
LIVLAFWHAIVIYFGTDLGSVGNQGFNSRLRIFNRRRVPCT